MEDIKVTQQGVNEAEAFFNLATLLGRSIRSAAFQITHPGYKPERIWIDRADQKPDDDESIDHEESILEEPEKSFFVNLADGGPIIHSDEGDIDEQIEQIIAMYTPGIAEILRRSALPVMFDLACSQFSFDLADSDPERDLSESDKIRAALAWVIVKRVFAVRHPDETAIIISITEGPIRGTQRIAFRPIDEIDRQFIVETCSLCQHVIRKDMTLPEILTRLAKELKQAGKAESVGRLAPLGSVPNGDALGWLYRVVSNGNRIPHSTGNRHESIIAQRKGDAVRYTRSNKQSGSTFTVEIAQADKYLSKTSKTFKKLFLFALQKMAAQHEPAEVGFSLQELVDLGMYATTSNAIRGIKEFFAQQKQTMISGTLKKGKTTVKEEGGILFYHYHIENGYVKLSVNENFNLDFITNYYTIFPRFAYALSNNAFSLVRYIFFLARQNTKDIKAKGSFNISLDAVRENLGLPAPDDVRNRRYRQLIIEPIEQAIEEIEDALNTVPEAKNYSFTITPFISDTTNINQWLEGYLEVGLQGDFAETFVNLATKAERDREKRERLKAAELAKLAAKREISNGIPQ